MGRIRSFLKKSEILRAGHRSMMTMKYNSRDFFDTYLAPARRAVPCPLGFVFGGLGSQHHRAMQKGEFEPDEVKWLSGWMLKTDLFVDVGANVGYFTCLARQLKRPAIAIEPMQKNLQVLMANLIANGWDDTEVIASGVSNKAGIVQMFGVSSTGVSLVPNWAGAPAGIRRAIPVSTLDTVLGDRFLDQRLLIKMDVEGHEYSALLGGKSLLQRVKKPVWLIEISNHEFHPAGRNPDYAATFSMMWNAGYQVWALTADGLKRVIESELSKDEMRPTSLALNYAFIPPDLAES